jgi:Flp pilus assembly protein TadG
VAVLRNRRTKRAQALVELGLMALPLFLIVLGATDLSRMFYYTTAVTNAAREGARHGAYYDPTTSPGGNTYDTDAAIYAAVTAEAQQGTSFASLSLSEPCHPNTTCTGGLTNCPSYPYASTLYPPVAAPDTGYVFVCFNNTTTATTATVGQPIRVTILYSFVPVAPLLGTVYHTAASTEILAEGNN